jgi:hypothetical protein
MPDLSVIIVNWNVRDLLAECLRSLERHHGTLQLEVIVVDSASSDGSVTMLQEEFPWVRLLASPQNIGFVGGNNAGLALAQGRYLLLLNPDTVVHPHALATMVAYLESHPQVGIVGPHTLNPDGTYQSTRRRFPSLLLAILEDSAPRPWRDWFTARDLPDEGMVEVDWVQGSALLARREVYQQLGGLNSEYVMFFEETDWCQQAKRHGWQVYYLGNAYITHYGGGSTDQVVVRKHVHYQFSKLRYFRRYHGWLAAWLLRLGLILSYSLQVLIEAVKLALQHKPFLRRERIAVYGQVLVALLYRGEKVGG